MAAIDILTSLLPGLLLTVLGAGIYIVAPTATTDPRERAQHFLLAIASFVLLFLSQGGAALDAASAFAYISAGITPNIVLDIYKTTVSAKSK